MNQTRTDVLNELLKQEPAYRHKQVLVGLFQKNAGGWESIKTLPQPLIKKLEEQIPWVTVQEVKTFTSRDSRTVKAVLELQDKLRIESVLMKNSRTPVRYTICVSSQVGCAMRCSFCATGKMGLKRNLTSDEITDQYRFWCSYLETQNIPRADITNIVFMGMGEPLQNYEAVRETCRTVLEYTDIGPTHIVVSTVGVKHTLEKMLEDPLWPPVRMALSLHSAIEKTRKSIVPSHAPGFLEFFLDWSTRYFKKYPERRRHLSLEYVLLSGVNDGPQDAQALASYAAKIKHSRVNLIYWNPVTDMAFKRSIPEAALAMQKQVKEKGAMCTIRDTQGQDIDAACGQLIIQNSIKV